MARNKKAEADEKKKAEGAVNTEETKEAEEASGEAAKTEGAAKESSEAGNTAETETEEETAESTEDVSSKDDDKLEEQSEENASPKSEGEEKASDDEQSEDDSSDEQTDDKALIESLKTELLLARIENAFLIKGAPVERAQRLSQLVKQSVVVQDGKLDTEALNSEIEEILKEFPTSEKDKEEPGLKIGGDGNNETKKTTKGEKSGSGKRWNRFN